MNLIKKNATVIVIFGEQQLARNMMSAATRKGVYERFVWLGSEAWGKREYVSNGNERVLEGAISVSYVTQPPKGFIEYFMNLTPTSAKETNPFFYEYWEGHLECRLEGFPETPFNQHYTRICSKEERIPDELYLRAMPSAQLVRDAAHVFARALHEFQKEHCGDVFCNELNHITGTQLKEFVKRVHFEDEYGNSFQFDKNGDALPKYDIINYQKINGTNEYRWVTVGKYTETKDNVPILQLHLDAMVFKHDKKRFPESLCSAPCLPGEAMIIMDQDVCCWHCLNCSEYEIVEKETKCTECLLGSVPNENKTSCVELPIKRIHFGNPWAIGAMTFSALGMLSCIFVGIVFCIYWDTPIIKASGRDLSSFLLLGIALLFSTTFAVVAKPAASSCGAVRFFLGFYYTLCYSAIVIKTRRIALIFDQSLRKECRKVRYTRPKSQMMMIAALLAVEAVITAVWLVHDPPAATFLYPSRVERVLICKGSDSASYLVGLIYPFILMGFCTVYAFKTRKCPDGFNEARLIAFTNYTTCIIWMAFIPTFTINSSNTIRTITLSTLFNLSGSVQLLCLFMPKVHIALFRPEKNTKESVMCYYQHTGSSETPVKIQEVK
ncbi:metabotropic glutamate receptor 3-like [Uloborus diversus]|uniref:metabotropic glutamate receptor 3-like n=1 Tax=Uloborus diversus TaxID=327109 RepID=UPI00240A99EA|nr:metabotropic glutamate receptor 3-like [Uloborus diversus]